MQGISAPILVLVTGFTPFLFLFLNGVQELKGNSLSIGSWDDREETRRVCLKSTDDTLEHHTLKQIHSSAMFENEHSQNLFVPDKGVLAITHDSSTSPAVDCNAPPNLPAELAIDGSCENGVLHPSIEKAAEVNLLVTNNMEDRTEHLTSIRSISEFEETASAEYLRHGISSSATSPSEAGHSGPVKVTTASHSIIIISEKIKVCRCIYWLSWVFFWYSLFLENRNSQFGSVD